jgi:hypothetical protein
MQPRPETARHIDEIGMKLFAGLGSNAISVEVYGSAASDDFAPRHSDVNLFIALHDVSFADLRLIGTVLQRESDRLGLRFATPLVVRPDFLDTAGDSFPIELTDMRLRHRLLAGADLIPRLLIPAEALRTAAEREARTTLLRLHSLAIHRPQDFHVREALAQLVSAVVVICSARLDAPTMRLPRQPELLRRTSEQAGVNLSHFEQLHEMREGRRAWPEDLDLDRFLDALIDEMEALVRAIDAHRV